MKGTKVIYEWCLEEKDEWGDIEPHFWETYEDCRRLSKDFKDFDIVLVRDLCHEDLGVLDREWSYVDKDGNFDDGFGRPVPQRYQKEVARYHS